MSKYGGDYGGRGPPAERWTPERFQRERGGRQSTVVERDTHYEERDNYSNAGSRRRESSADGYHDRRPARGGGGRDRFEDDHFFEKEERYGPPARRSAGGGGGFGRDRRYEEDEEIDSFVDYKSGRGERERRYEDDRRFSSGRAPAPPRAPRPGMLIRRQSSLDTFDRKPAPRYGPPRPRSPEVITMPGPGSGRNRRHSPPRYHERDYDDIRIAEPDRNGDEHFRGWREREIERVRRRRDSSPHEPPAREIIEEEEIIEEKPFPRKGRTKMSARLVNKKALFDMGYPYEDEFAEDGQHFVIILKALDKTLIDSVLFRSKEYNERERERITYAIEAPPPPPDRGEVIERREIIIDKDASEVPRSVREWDQMSGALGGGSHAAGHGGGGGHSHAGTKSYHGGGKSHAGGKSEHGGGAKSEHKSEHLSIHESRHDSHHSRSRGRSPQGSSHSTIKEKERRRSRSSSSDEKQIVIERKPSRKSKSRHRSQARRGSNHRKVEYVEEEEVGVSNEMNTGPLALVLPSRSRSKSRKRSSIGERRIDEELKDLEKEKKMLQKERKHSKKYHRDHSVSSSNSGDEVLIERKDSHGRKEDFEVKKDRKDSKIIKGMLATLT